MISKFIWMNKICKVWQKQPQLLMIMPLLIYKNHFDKNKNNGSPKSNSFGGKNPKGNVSTSSPSGQNSQVSSQSDSMGKKPTNSCIPTCGHCRKCGHVMYPYIEFMSIKFDFWSCSGGNLTCFAKKVQLYCWAMIWQVVG